MKQWLRMSVLGITVASGFCGCGGKDTNDPDNTAGKASSGGSPSSSGGSGGVPAGSLGGRSSGGVGGSNGGHSAGSGLGGFGGGFDSAGSGARVGEGGAPYLPEGGVGGADIEPPGKGGPPKAECPGEVPSEIDTCEGKGECTYVGLRCDCKTDAKSAHWTCRGSGDACPAVPPALDAACENPDDAPPLECPYPSGAECRCMDSSWHCVTPPKPGDPKPPGGPKPGDPPKPGEAGAGGGPPIPPEPEGGAGPRGPRD